MEILRIERPADPAQLQEAHLVRELVFQNEQRISQADDFDQLDLHQDTVHFIAKDDKDHKPVGTARIRILDENSRAKVERVAVLKSQRGKNIGAQIMSEIEAYLKERGIPEAFLDAQESAWGFYERLGYVREGNVFEEVGIPHVKMVKRLPK